MDTAKYIKVYFGLFYVRLQPIGVPNGAPMEKSIHSKEYTLFLEMLRAAREKSGLTQEDVAERLGESQSFVSKCERGERRLDVVEMRAWCAALRVSFPSFLRRFDQGCQS